MALSTRSNRRPTSMHRRTGLGRLAAIEFLEDRTLLTLLGQQLFPSNNPWNQQITSAPTAANSAAIISNIISLTGSNGRLHPDFGQVTGGDNPLYGIPFNIVHGNSQAKVHVIIDAYPGESDLQDAPIPPQAVIEGDLQNGPTIGVDNRGDSHLIVWDEDNNVAYEFYGASRPTENTDGMWHADQESVWNLNTNTFRTIGWTSADAAGLPILPGLVRPDEALPVSQGGQGIINHAIRFTLNNNVILNQFLYPAEHTANPGNNNPAIEPAMGTRFRLKANVDISQLDPESKVIAQAMKDYGLILADNGSNFYFSGASYSVNASNQETLTWNDNDIQDSVHGLKSLTFSDFEVVDSTPVVTGVNASSGAAGSTVTITGQNFSGAAGHLQVLFGSALASTVTVVDDSHVTVVVPPGSGAVDVRVQSGVTTANDPSNITNPIFGYGTSAVSPADRFTYISSSPPLTVSGTVFLDLNVDSIAETGEPALGGRTVFLDLKADGTLDPGDPSAVTDASGHYSITGLIAGTYTVRLLTYPSDVVTGLAVNGESITLGASQPTAVANFGIVTESILLPLTPSPAPFGTKNTDLATAEVKGLYNLILDRAPDPTGSAAAIAYLKAGGALSQLATNLYGSAEYESDVVGSYYKTFLGRVGASSEIKSWVARMQGGMTEEQVATGFLDSPAFSQAHSSNSDFVQALYHEILGRDGSSAEISAWAALLNSGGGRTAIVQDILGSNEALTRSVAGLYVILLARLPDTAGLKAGVASLQGGGSLANLGIILAGSAEFAARAGKTVG